MCTVDITGSWMPREGFLSHIVVSEPEILSGDRAVFTQTLVLPAGDYRLHLLYDERLDRGPLHALGGNARTLDGLSVDGVPVSLPLHAAGDLLEGTCPLSSTGEPIQLRLAWGDARVCRTLLEGEKPWDNSGCFVAVDPQEEGELLTIRSIPFLLRTFCQTHQAPCMPQGYGIDNPILDFDGGNLSEWENSVYYPLGGARPSRLHFLGMTHNVDFANGSWYSIRGDDGFSHFVGDHAGDILLHETDGSMQVIPLIFGFNLWYGYPYDILWSYPANPYNPAIHKADNFDSSLFFDFPAGRNILAQGIQLIDGVRHMGSWRHNARYVFTVQTDGRPLAGITIRTDPAIYGRPLISAITLEGKDLPTPQGTLRSLPAFQPQQRLPAMLLEDIRRKTYAPKVEEIRRLLYTFTDAIPWPDEAQKPVGYFGPSYAFRGTREAVAAATCLYHNGPECAAHIADTGSECCSSTMQWATSHYTSGIGIWLRRPPMYDGLPDFFEKYSREQPGHWPGRLNNAWARGVGELLREAVCFGYDKFAHSYLNWMDRILFEEANPPHFNRVLGGMDAIMEQRPRMVGDVEERGNRENDGHGMCMIGRYMAWKATGCDPAFNRAHWEATKACVDWIRWQLDTDTIYPGVRKDVLFTDSECAHDSYDIYSSGCCLHAVRLYVRMAEQLGEWETAAQWRALADRLAHGILDNLVDRTSFGRIWHTEEDCDWQDHAHKLVHVQLAADGLTYTPLDDAHGDALERKFLRIDRSSFAYLMRNGNPNFLRELGYGQGFMIQAALLLDEMAQAEQLLYALLGHCCLPRFGGWVFPEGVIVHRGDDCYVPVNGYMGQDSHVADATKALRLMLGVDDNHGSVLHLVPRFPAAWTDMQVRDFPQFSGGRGHVSYRYERLPDGERFTFETTGAQKGVRIRLGPVDPNAGVRITLDGRDIAFTERYTGDSRWIWTQDFPAASGCLRLEYKR